MLTILIHTIQTAETLIKSGYSLSQSLKKDFGIMMYVEHADAEEVARNEIEDFLKPLALEQAKILVYSKKISELATDCEILEASFLLIQWCDKGKKKLRSYLNYCRNLRIPYLFFKDTFSEINFDKVLVPVGFLIEEYEKTQFAAAFGRFCYSEITLLLANDYGSKAQRTFEKMKIVFDKFDLKYHDEKAKRDSFKLDKEAVQKAEDENFGLVIMSASRDYGLDDIVFGPKELHLIRKSKVPLLLINPRGDLYTLCD
ncbi:MAG: universal stress protein [Porphyromonadaceae bacterium]|jgi:hypothetical protein|nr:universal stress protein [Porphyromonadaceae bacterium]